MCVDPVTIIGIAVSGLGMMMQMGQTNQVAETNQAPIYEQMTRTETAHELRKEDSTKEKTRAIGLQKAQYGASGVDPLDGSAVDTFANTAEEFALRDYADAFDTDAELSSLYHNVDVIRSEAKQKNQSAMTNFIVTAGRTLL